MLSQSTQGKKKKKMMNLKKKKKERITSIFTNKWMFMDKKLFLNFVILVEFTDLQELLIVLGVTFAWKNLTVKI
jgi:hypothetical protein